MVVSQASTIRIALSFGMDGLPHKLKGIFRIPNKFDKPFRPSSAMLR
jgi:hypothetical protein